MMAKTLFINQVSRGGVTIEDDWPCISWPPASVQCEYVVFHQHISRKHHLHLYNPHTRCANILTA